MPKGMIFFIYKNAFYISKYNIYSAAENTKFAHQSDLGVML